ncbi:vWA domain-containing protein [Methyloferula stellata]|uniref:vWA domain-containing protein n=1 Tax=Methyloferula stellata TaxID=876270 RepID=UPI00037258BF|nr:VWA domain-containing protein [Methyloferula stellata]
MMAPLALAAPSFDLGEPVRLRFAAFVRSLRANGFTVGLAESQDALRIFCAIEPTNRTILLAALRSLFASRQADWEKFDAIFNAFWFAYGTKGTTRFEDRRQAPARSLPPAGPEDGPPQSGAGERLKRPDSAGDPASTEGGRDRQGGAAAQEALSKKDFRHILNQEELKRAYALADRLAAKMRTRLTRRDRAAKHGRRLDFRRVIHRSIARGGTPIDLVFRRRKTKPLRLVMLLDTSGSMSAYTPAFVRFMHGMLGSFKYASTFLFHTRLVDVTGAMTEKDPQRAIDRFSLMTEGVGGGTKIGESLATFNARYAARSIRSRTAVMIISDGFETGDPDRLAKEMSALRRRCRRIVWLNPMAGWQDYAPEAAGMKAALPFVDLFAPAHNLESLEALEPYLARL